MYFAVLSILALAVAIGCRSTPKADGCSQHIRASRPPSNELGRLPPSPYLLGLVGTGSVIGYLADSATNLGIPQALVAVRTDTTRYATLYVYTDTTGGFLLRDVPPGEYFFYATRPGYVPNRLKIRVDAGKADTMQLRTHRASNLFLCTTIITS